MWRIYGFELNEMYPLVYILQLHLEDQHSVSFRKYDYLSHVLRDDSSSRSMLIEFFCRNKIDENAHKLLYKEYPEQFVWNQRDKIRTPRKKKNVIGRIVAKNPVEGERYYLRLLLNHVRGPTSFEDLKNIGGVVASTFREAALLSGLLETNNSLDKCLEEASMYQMPYSLRHFFVTILIYYNPSNSKLLWNKFEQVMSEDFRQLNGVVLNVRTKVLQSIASTLKSMGKDINSYNLVDFKVTFDEDQVGSREIHDELNITISEEDLLTVESLNAK